MAKNTDPKCRQCRRAGEKLFLKGERCYAAKCAIVKRNYPPGVHGAKGKKRVSDYGIQLNEKQKAKREYGLMEKQFRLTFDKARRQKGNAGENFLRLLETRLDNAVYRLHLAASRTQARQLVNHGHFTVNARKVNIPSYTVRTGDVIAIKEGKKRGKVFSDLKERVKNKEIPGWLNLDAENMAAKVLHQPDTGKMKPNFNMQMIIEFYSR